MVYINACKHGSGIVVVAEMVMVAIAILMVCGSNLKVV